MRTSGACDEACNLFGCLISLCAISESVCIPVQFSDFSARARALISARHSIWKTDVALTLSSCAKCMLITGRCFHCGESSVMTMPAVAVDLVRSGESSTLCRCPLCCVYEPSVKILTLLRPLSLTRSLIIAIIESSIVGGVQGVCARCSLAERNCLESLGCFLPLPGMSLVMVARVTLSAVLS